MTVVKTTFLNFHDIFPVVLFPTLFFGQKRKALALALLSEDFQTIFDFELSGRIKMSVILTKIKKMY